MKKPQSVKTMFASYAIGNKLGEGGCGEVYAAIDESNRNWAIKFLDIDRATTEKIKRFKNEYFFCNRNQHPNIIHVVDYGIDGNNAPFFVMPLYSSSLRPLMGKMQPQEIMGMFAKIMDGIDASHKLGVIHRDIKPENILVDKDSLVIADFGIAHFEEDELYTTVETKDGSRLANFQYAAPEQRMRGRKIDATSDIYALGLVFNEMFTGEIPYGTNYKQISDVTDLFPYLDDIVGKMLNQNPLSRYSSVEEIKTELIARGQNHLTLQKISHLEKIIIPETNIDDPISHEPTRIISPDWEDNVLKITLNHHVSAKWEEAFKNMPYHQCILGKGPERFVFRGNVASIGVDGSQAQQVLHYFKQWLPLADQVYLRNLKNERDAEAIRKREEISRKIQKEQERIKVLESIKI